MRHRDDTGADAGQVGPPDPVGDGDKPGVTSGEAVELRAARRRIKMLEQENEVLRRAAAYLGQANLPKG